MLNMSMTRKKDLYESSAIRLWTRPLAVQALLPGSDFVRYFDNVQVTDKVVKVCINKVLHEYSLNTYNLWYQFAANHNFGAYTWKTWIWENLDVY